MTEEVVERADVLKQLENILSIQEKISDYVHERLCITCDDADDESWDERRKAAFKNVRGLIDKYAFSRKLPRDDLGILTQAVVSELLDIQHTLFRVLVMIDIVRGESFNEIFMDSMTTISDKVHEQMKELTMMVRQRAANSDDAVHTLESIIKLEREIDEDNIVICRQISVATGGDSDFVCYMMRKIVAELEHISDYAKECAEIIAEI